MISILILRKSNLLIFCIIIVATNNVGGITYECEIVEKYDAQGQTFCVFRDVQYSSNTTDIAFKAPGDPAPTRVVFESSQMEHLPREFLEKYGNNLKVLNVSGCNLTSVVITKSMEELIASDNYISKIIVHQNSQNAPMKQLYLQSNRIEDISNVTKHCKNLRILDLSRNMMLAKKSELDFSIFNGLDQLEYLLLADIGALYILDDKKVSLPALTLLDLSVNNLLPVDLRVEYFKSFKSLATLRLNSNGFGQLDYNYLTQIESLKEVYLEGNEFTCSYLRTMIKHLNDNGKQTPVSRPASRCPAGYNIELQMCCKSDGSGPSAGISRPPITTTHASATQSPVTTTTGMTPSYTTKKSGEQSGKNSAAYFMLNLKITIFGLVIGLFWSRK